MTHVTRAIALGTLIVGVLDGADAVIVSLMRGGSSTRMFQGIAAGWFGREAALSGGMVTASAGVFFHFTIAFGVVAVYACAAAVLPVLRRRPLVYGPLYGLAVYAFMNLVVIPLSAIGPVQFSPSVNQVFAHVCLVGIPAALSVAWLGGWHDRREMSEDIHERSSVRQR